MIDAASPDLEQGVFTLPPTPYGIEEGQMTSSVTRPFDDPRRRSNGTGEPSPDGNQEIESQTEFGSVRVWPFPSPYRTRHAEENIRRFYNGYFHTRFYWYILRMMKGGVLNSAPSKFDPESDGTMNIIDITPGSKQPMNFIPVWSKRQVSPAGRKHRMLKVEESAPSWAGGRNRDRFGDPRGEDCLPAFRLLVMNSNLISTFSLGCFLNMFGLDPHLFIPYNNDKTPIWGRNLKEANRASTDSKLEDNRREFVQQNHFRILYTGSFCMILLSEKLLPPGWPKTALVLVGKGMDGKSSSFQRLVDSNRGWLDDAVMSSTEKRLRDNTQGTLCDALAFSMLLVEHINQNPQLANCFCFLDVLNIFFQCCYVETVFPLLPQYSQSRPLDMLAEESSQHTSDKLRKYLQMALRNLSDINFQINRHKHFVASIVQYQRLNLGALTPESAERREESAQRRKESMSTFNEILKDHTHILQSLDAQYQACHSQVDALRTNLEIYSEFKSVEMAKKSIQESQKAINLTILASIFLPISLAASIYGMNVREIVGNDSTTVSDFAKASISLLGATATLAWALTMWRRHQDGPSSLAKRKLIFPARDDDTFPVGRVTENFQLIVFDFPLWLLEWSRYLILNLLL